MCNAFINLSYLNTAQRKSLYMLLNEDNRTALSKQSGMLILRAFQLLRAKIKHWADLKNPIKEGNYFACLKAYEVAKK